jgi:hypothetical protein
MREQVSQQREFPVRLLGKSAGNFADACVTSGSDEENNCARELQKVSQSVLIDRVINHERGGERAAEHCFDFVAFCRSTLE